MKTPTAHVSCSVSRLTPGCSSARIPYFHISPGLAFLPGLIGARADTNLKINQSVLFSAGAAGVSHKSCETEVGRVLPEVFPPPGRGANANHPLALV